MWICKSCRMENEDNDSLCYMCGTKRPHAAPVRPPVREEEQEIVSAPVPTPAENAAVAFASPLSQTDELHTSEDSIVFHRNEAELIDENEIILPAYTQPLATEQPELTPPAQADVNLFASVFNVPSEPTPLVRPTAEPPRQDTPQSDFSAFFSDFLAETATPPAPVQEVNIPFSPPPAPPASPMPDTPPFEDKEQQPQQQEKDRKTVVVRVCAFLRTLFVAALCLWTFAFCLAAIMRLAGTSGGDLADVFAELIGTFAERLQDIPGVDILNRFLSAGATLTGGFTL